MLIEAMLATLDKNVEYIVTDDIREYLTQYQQKNDLSKVTIDNIRRILSSFFSWLEDEDYILPNLLTPDNYLSLIPVLHLSMFL